MKNFEVIVRGVNEAVKSIIPLPIKVSDTVELAESVNTELAVSVGVVGDLTLNISIEGSEKVFSGVAKKMFGDEMQGEMLYGFVAEVIGNMVAGNMVTQLSSEGYNLNITPPNVVTGKVNFVTLGKSYRQKIYFEDVGEVSLIVTGKNQ